MTAWYERPRWRSSVQSGVRSRFKIEMKLGEYFLRKVRMKAFDPTLKIFGSCSTKLCEWNCATHSRFFFFGWSHLLWLFVFLTATEQLSFASALWWIQHKPVRRRVRSQLFWGMWPESWIMLRTDSVCYPTIAEIDGVPWSKLSEAWLSLRGHDGVRCMWLKPGKSINSSTSEFVLFTQTWVVESSLYFRDINHLAY